MRFGFILFFLFSFLGFAQEGNSARINNNFSALNTNLSGAWVFNKETQDVKGSVYLFEDWKTKGIISTYTNQNLSLSGLNYDTMTNTFVAKVSNDSVYVFNNADIKEVVINKKLFKRYLNEGEQSYYEVIAVSKDLEILKKYDKILVKGILEPLTQKTSPDKYVEKTTYYSFKDSKIEKLKLSTKPFLEIFGGKADEIKKYMSKNNLSVKKEECFQTILNFYNTL